MDSLLLQSVSMLAYQLPEFLVALWAVLLFALWTPPAAGRTRARIGAGLLLASAVLRALLSVVQVVIIHGAQSSAVDISTRLSILNAASMLLNLLAVAGLILLILGARQAMQAGRSA